MNQSQAYLCPHPAQRPSHIPPILKVVTECWVELPGWLTSDFLLVVPFSALSAHVCYFREGNSQCGEYLEQLVLLTAATVSTALLEKV